MNAGRSKAVQELRFLGRELLFGQNVLFAQFREALDRLNDILHHGLCRRGGAVSPASVSDWGACAGSGAEPDSAGLR